MQQWEYLTLYRQGGLWLEDRYNARNPSEKLTDLGQESWEMISACYDGGGFNFYLKRPVGAKAKGPSKKTKRSNRASEMANL